MALVIPKKPRYRKRLGGFSSADYRHDDSVLDIKVAKNFYNVDFSSGALRDGYGIAAHAAVPSEAVRYWVYRYFNTNANAYVDQYVFQIATGHMEFYDSYTDKTRFVSGVGYTPVTAINYRVNSEDVLLLSCDGHKLITWNGRKLVEYADSPVISSMALHYERLFVTSKAEPTKLFFSDDLDPTNWNISAGEGGFIELLDERGELNKVVSFADYLYIFRERGISRVSAFGDQNSFSVTNLYVSAGRIYPESIAVCGNGIMFAASDGLFMFDGYDAVKVLRSLDGLIDYASVGGCAYYNGKYYLSCRMNFDDGKTVGCESGAHTRNGLLVFDTSSGEYSIARGLDIDMINVATFHGEELCFAHDSAGGGVIKRCGKRFDIELDKHWESPFVDLGMPDKTKFVRELYVDSTVDITLGIADGKKTKSYVIKAGKRRVRPNMSCVRLKLSVDTDHTDINIAAPTVIYSVN